MMRIGRYCSLIVAISIGPRPGQASGYLKSLPMMARVDEQFLKVENSIA
jgi:hypothetical protein